MAQRDTAGLQDLLEVCALWSQIEPDLHTYFGKGAELDKITAMWTQGIPGFQYYSSEYFYRFFNFKFQNTVKNKVQKLKSKIL